MSTEARLRYDPAAVGEPRRHSHDDERASAQAVAPLDAGFIARQWGGMAERLEWLWDRLGSEENQDIYFALAEAQEREKQWSAAQAGASGLDERLVKAFLRKSGFFTWGHDAWIHESDDGTVLSTDDAIAAAYAEADREAGGGATGDDPLPERSGRPPAALPGDGPA